MRIRTILLATLVASTAFAFLASSADAATPRRLTVFGDTGLSSATRSNIDLAISEGSTGFLGLGDYEYDHSASDWLTAFKPLTDKGHWMARGNHDDVAALSSMFTSGSQWSTSINGARVVAINTESRMDVGSSQYNSVRGALCNAPESVRVLVMHKGWWLVSGARHLGTEFPGSPSAMDQMVKDCKVSLVLAGHEHNYQRMVRNGVSYAIVGTGGESLYTVGGSPSGTVATCTCYGHMVLDISSAGYSAFFETIGGSRKDSWSFTAGTTTTTTTTPSPAPTPTPTSSGAIAFSSSSGNEWWAQVKVSGGPTAVAARDTGGAWVPLALKSYGWAGSFHIESGHLVQYRATKSDGSLVESCWYTHPGGACTTTTSTTTTTTTTTTITATPAAGGAFVATWKNVRGNEWWIETGVTTSGGTLSGVDARVNGGAWIALDHRSYGSWAKSIHAAPGASVEFRARATSGDISVSGKYAWPPA